MTNHFQVKEIRSGLVIRIFKNRKLAIRYADKKDLEYGCINYIVQPYIPAFVKVQS